MNEKLVKEIARFRSKHSVWIGKKHEWMRLPCQKLLINQSCFLQEKQKQKLFSSLYGMKEEQLPEECLWKWLTSSAMNPWHKNFF